MPFFPRQKKKKKRCLFPPFTKLTLRLLRRHFHVLREGDPPQAVPVGRHLDDVRAPSALTQKKTRHRRLLRDQEPTAFDSPPRLADLRPRESALCTSGHARSTLDKSIVPRAHDVLYTHTKQRALARGHTRNLRLV